MPEYDNYMERKSGFKYVWIWHGFSCIQFTWQASVIDSQWRRFTHVRGGHGLHSKGVLCIFGFGSDANSGKNIIPITSKACVELNRTMTKILSSIDVITFSNPQTTSAGDETRRLEPATVMSLRSFSQEVDRQRQTGSRKKHVETLRSPLWDTSLYRSWMSYIL